MTGRGPRRRDLLVAGVAAAGQGLLPRQPARAQALLPSRRPPASRRRFASHAVEALIDATTPRIGDPVLAWMFANCFPNTLDTAVTTGRLEGRPDSFVVTGDIDALWLRDSAAQLSPYLPLARQDAGLRRLCAGLIARHALCLLIDPYANAFLRDPAGRVPLIWARHDITVMKLGVAERKWELDSLCHVLAFAHGYWQATGDTTPFDAMWHHAVAQAVGTMRVQQRLHDDGPYRFQRPSELASETLFGGGYGNPSRKVGLIHSMFRPSDDACLYPFFIPANLFAASVLRRLSGMLPQVGGERQLAADCDAFAKDLTELVGRHGVMPTAAGPVWAYEIDGFGNQLFMDDANIPSLLALPLFTDIGRDNPLYRRTRARALGPDNPYFFRGKAGEGIGGPHEGPRMIWPMSIIARAMTSDDNGEIRQCLRWLRDSQAGTGLMHESFDQDDPAHFTRGWFGWANGLFGTLILTLRRDRPALLEASL